MTVVVSGVSEFSRALAEIGARVDAANPVAVMQGAALIEREIKLQIRGGHPKGTKTGASVGGPPQNISGTLRRSVITEGPIPTGPSTFGAKIGPTTVYSRAVELGGAHNWPAGVTYPYVLPGLKAALEGEKLRDIAARAWGQAIIR